MLKMVYWRIPCISHESGWGSWELGGRRGLSPGAPALVAWWPCWALKSQSKTVAVGGERRACHNRPFHPRIPSVSSRNHTQQTLLEGVSAKHRQRKWGGRRSLRWRCQRPGVSAKSSLVLLFCQFLVQADPAVLGFTEIAFFTIWRSAATPVEQVY